MTVKKTATLAIAVLLLGPGWTMDGLSRFDAALVADTVADAVVRRAAHQKVFRCRTPSLFQPFEIGLKTATGNHHRRPGHKYPVQQ